MLSHFVDSILNLSPAILGTWGYGIVFAISIIESLPLIGLAVPGGVVVVAAGFFARIGILQLIPAIFIVAVGAFIGDSISFLLGRKYGYNFLTHIGKYIFFKPVHFEKAKSVLQAHPRKAIFGGRFHALTRCVIPFASGAAEVKTPLFFIFSSLSCVTWSIVSVLIGYIFGHGFQTASKYLGTMFFVALGLSLIMVYSYEFISRFTEKNKHILARYQIYPLILNIISIYVVAKISESVIEGFRLHRADAVANHFFNLTHQSFVTKIFIIITNLATPTNLTIIAFGLALYFIYRHRWYFLARMPAALLSGVISDSVLKKLVHVSRPLNPLIVATDFSFPSGHATLAVIFFGLLVYFFKDQIHSKISRRIFILVCVIATFAVCISRLYLNVHWLSDVLAGMALGVFWLTLYIVLFHFFTSLSPKQVEQEFKEELKVDQSVL